MSTLVPGIGPLVPGDGTGRDGLGVRSGWALAVEGGCIAWSGPADAAPAADERLDLGGRTVVPGFVDSHTHLVFAGDRAAEFTARMAGTPYDGGGIASTVAATSEASEEVLRALLSARVRELRAQGTTSVEIKSGYGLDVDAEVLALRLAREVTPETTFLGAHVVPPAYRGDRAAYLDLVTGPMLRACAPYARWVDVFCEPHSPHAFTEEESHRVVLAGQRAGLGVRVHGNQLGLGPGVQLAVDVGAASVDHCTYLSAADIDALADAAGQTVATLLPGVEFSTRSPYPDARALIDAGVEVALASDYNPGTCASSSMAFVIALAVREMGMTPAEALLAATRGGARALRRADIGHLRPGARAHLAVIDAPTHAHLAYRPGVPITRGLVIDDGH